ncbi:MAG: sulfotransferase domain-containing protein, partial [Bacteroidota bacterium]
ELFVSERKEPNFFGYETVDPAQYDIPETIEHYHHSVTELDDYLELFKNAREGQILGETSNLYLYSDTACDRIKHYIPEVKLIAILRQPAERLYSRYLHLAREDKLPTKEFEDLFDQSSIWWRRPDLVTEGFYAKHLVKFYETFPKDRIKVFFYDDLRKSVDDLLKELYEFLGVDSTFVPDTSQQLNKSGFIKNRAVHQVIGSRSKLVQGIKSTFPALFRMAKANKTIFRAVNNLRDRNLNRPKLSQELRSRITNEIYVEDILKLEKMLDVDLSHWR